MLTARRAVFAGKLPFTPITVLVTRSVACENRYVIFVDVRGGAIENPLTFSSLGRLATAVLSCVEVVSPPLRQEKAHRSTAISRSAEYPPIVSYGRAGVQIGRSVG